MQSDHLVPAHYDLMSNAADADCCAQDHHPERQGVPHSIKARFHQLVHEQPEEHPCSVVSTQRCMADSSEK